MRFRIALPLAELTLVAVLSGVVAVCWLGWQALGPNDGPQAFASPQFKVVGNELWQNGRHVGNWVPPDGDQPGRWESTPFVMPEIPAAE